MLVLAANDVGQFAQMDFLRRPAQPSDAIPLKYTKYTDKVSSCPLNKRSLVIYIVLGIMDIHPARYTPFVPEYACIKKDTA